MLNSESFAHQIKIEVINNITSLKHKKAFIKGLIFSNGIWNENNYVLVLKSNEIFNKVVQFLTDIRVPFTIKKNIKTHIYVDKVDINLNNITEYHGSFFAGVFCGSGNISTKTTTSYHLEFSSRLKENIDFLVSVLNKYDFNFSIFNRKEKWFAYIKKLDLICDFLGAIEAKNAYFELQDIKISRDIENSINRVQNIDISNMTRVAKSNIKHSKNINFIFENNLEKYFTEEQLLFFKLKLDNSYSTLNELSDMLYERYKINMTKSGLNHWLIKLNTIAKMYGV
ncbi:DNA-binding protein WhiA [Mycoplasma crocodyli]|uniref:Probable cell division protein WhiA n=1 Tax=Mycoplasma crocodyli (strain ATCC 51981 / MP145) TaxID=512564 RepID=D5E522_MYCCM|nr:DNA-binding protein WhiA [Mycoplasma crocodyli]ADE19643.1 conserved hypothetical protein [Mycoplasma crocodyli MP145]